MHGQGYDDKAGNMAVRLVNTIRIQDKYPKASNGTTMIEHFGLETIY